MSMNKNGENYMELTKLSQKDLYKQIKEQGNDLENLIKTIYDLKKF